MLVSLFMATYNSQCSLLCSSKLMPFITTSTLCLRFYKHIVVYLRGVLKCELEGYGLG